MYRKLILFPLLLGILTFNVFSQKKKSHAIEISDVLVSVAQPDLFLPDPFRAEIVDGDITIVRGKPFGDLKGMVYFNPGDKIPAENDEGSELFSIASSRFYQDTLSWISEPVDAANIYIKVRNTTDKKCLQKFFTPFYFSKYEVTNIDYREFTNWVKDSVIRSTLAAIYPQKYYTDTISKRLNRKISIDLKDEKTRKAIESLCYSSDEVLFMKPVFMIENYNYAYTENGVKKSVEIYPDTLVFIKDFPYSYFQPMFNYFRHPAFSEYPVTGINYYQAKAFCNWLQRFLKLDDGMFTGTVDLPNEYEWEYVNTGYDYNNQTNDVDCLTDLIATGSAAYSSDWINGQLGGKCKTAGNFQQDNSLIPHPVTNGKSKKSRMNIQTEFNSTENQIYDLGDNVSEWLNESYSENWLPYIRKREKLLSEVKLVELDTMKNYSAGDFYRRFFNASPYYGNDTLYFVNSVSKSRLADTSAAYTQNMMTFEHIRELQKQFGNYHVLLDLEKIYDSRCDKDGRLVRGGNWFDNRLSPEFTRQRNVRNVAGINAKTFVSPGSSSSMIGFRFVIRVKIKEDL